MSNKIVKRGKGPGFDSQQVHSFCEGDGVVGAGVRFTGSNPIPSENSAKKSAF